MPSRRNADDGSVARRGDQAAPYWPEQEMREAIRKFRDQGDHADCLRLLEADDGPAALLPLQQALKLARSREERDAFEDLSLICCAEERAGIPIGLVDEVVKSVEEAYGEYVERFVDVRPVAAGIVRAAATPPPVNCVVAVIGVAAQRAVGAAIPVSRKEWGEEVGLSAADCDECGGNDGGQGYIFCDTCLRKARMMLQIGSFRAVDPNMEPEDVARIILIQEGRRFGCTGCKKQPARRCHCAKEVKIPSRPRDGEVLKGSYVVSRKDWFCCVRLREN